MRIVFILKKLTRFSNNRKYLVIFCSNVNFVVSILQLNKLSSKKFSDHNYLCFFFFFLLIIKGSN